MRMPCFFELDMISSLLSACAGRILGPSWCQDSVHGNVRFRSFLASCRKVVWPFRNRNASATSFLEPFHDRPPVWVKELPVDMGFPMKLGSKSDAVALRQIMREVWLELRSSNPVRMRPYARLLWHLKPENTPSRHWYLNGLANLDAHKPSYPLFLHHHYSKTTPSQAINIDASITNWVPIRRMWSKNHF